MTPDQMMQMMQMQGFIQMQQQMQQRGNATAAAQPTAELPAVPSSMVTSIVLVDSSKDGELMLAAGQRTQVPIKVALNSEKEPTGPYSTAQSVRQKAASSFPEAGNEVSWKLFIGELKEGKPFDVAFVAGDNDAAVDASWREVFSCKVIRAITPVVFAQPCLSGRERIDGDRKRAASIAVTTDQAEVDAAVTMLSPVRPAKQGKGQTLVSVRSGKSPAQLDDAGKLERLRERVQVLIDKSQTTDYIDKATGKSSFILTDGKWTKPVLDSDGAIACAGFYRKIDVSNIDASFLSEDGALKKPVVNTNGSLKNRALQFACIHGPCLRATNGLPWHTSTVATDSNSKSSHHSSYTKEGGVILRSFQSTVKAHAESPLHRSGVSSAPKQTTRFFTVGAALLQTPVAQAGLQAAAATQSDATAVHPPALTPADPPEPALIVLRYPFNAAPDAKERHVAQLKMVDISFSKLAADSFVSENVFDLLRRYELQCALNSGLPSEQVLVMPPTDYLLIARRMNCFEKKNKLVIDLSTRVGSTFAVYQLLNSLQKQVGLVSSHHCRAVSYSLEEQIPTRFYIASHHLPPVFPLVSQPVLSELQFVSIPVLSHNHDSEMIWLPRFDIVFSMDSYPELHLCEVRQVHTFLQHVASSTLELVLKTAASGIPHQPKDGTNKNVCAFSATLFLQLALKLLKEHGPTPLLVQKLRELKVEEEEYHMYRKRAAKDINSLHREYGRLQQEARIKQQQADKAIGEPSMSF
jgi:hypothetical protein